MFDCCAYAQVARGDHCLEHSSRCLFPPELYRIIRSEMQLPVEESACYDRGCRSEVPLVNYGKQRRRHDTLIPSGTRDKIKYSQRHSDRAKIPSKHTNKDKISSSASVSRNIQFCNAWVTFTKESPLNDVAPMSRTCQGVIVDQIKLGQSCTGAHVLQSGSL